MKCTNCGAEVMDGLQNCPYCGASQVLGSQNGANQQQYGYDQNENTEDASWIIKIVCLLIPIVGVILYFVWKTNTPVKAKSCLIFAGIGFAINIIFSLV